MVILFMQDYVEVQIIDSDGVSISVPPSPNLIDKEQTDVTWLFLNKSLAREFRAVINSSPIFYRHPFYKPHFNLACAVIERLETCVFYLNEHQKYPHTEEEFLQFIMFACMLMDAVKQILLDLGIDKKKQHIFEGADNYKYFKSVCQGAPLFLPDENCPTDDEFWEYFRSITFAHPFGTDRPKFLEGKETQYSPWVIVHTRGPSHRNIPEPVGVRIYSSTRERTMDLVMPFTLIKAYVQSRYNRITLATEWVKNQIAIIREQWKNDKIDRTQTPENILLNIRELLKKQCGDIYSINDAYEYLTCKTTEPRNDHSVHVFRSAILNILPKICDAAEMVDHDELEELLGAVIRARPREMHPMAGYQLEKIFCYLNDSISTENVYWAQVQTDEFSKEFASKWVIIDSQIMSFDEIKLLTQVACYLEAQEQLKNPSVEFGEI